MTDRPTTSAPAPSPAAGPDPRLAATLIDLVADGTLTAAQADRVAARFAAAAAEPVVPPAAPADAPTRSVPRGRLAEIAGYAGGALLLGAVGLFLASGWADLSETARTLLLVCTTVLLLVVGAVVALDAPTRTDVRALGRDRDSARRRLVATLWTFAAGSAAGAAGLAATGHELGFAAAGGLTVAVATYALVPSALGQVAAWSAAVVLAVDVVAEAGDEPDAVPFALVLLVLALLWCGLAVAKVLREQAVGLALGAGLAVVAAHLPVMGGGENNVGYLLMALVAVAGFVGYLPTRSWPVLAAGVVATTLVVPEAVYDWTEGSVSAAGAMLLAGLTLLGASAAGLRLRNATD